MPYLDKVLRNYEENIMTILSFMSVGLTREVTVVELTCSQQIPCPTNPR